MNRVIKFRAWVELDNGCSEDDPAHYTEKVIVLNEVKTRRGCVYGK